MDLHIYLTAFISILVAINAPGVLPLFISFTEDIAEERHKIAGQSVLTAFLVAAGFMLLGSAVFSAIGIEVEDFMIAGGILLLVFSIVDIVFPDCGAGHPHHYAYPGWQLRLFPGHSSTNCKFHDRMGDSVQG
jgi:small neutral amino acid transporter SnatA (MarC family)